MHYIDILQGLHCNDRLSMIEGTIRTAQQFTAILCNQTHLMMIILAIPVLEAQPRRKLLLGVK